LLAANRRVDPRELTLALHAGAATLRTTVGQRECTFALTADRRDFLPLARLLAEALLAPRFSPDRLPAALARALLDDRRSAELVALVTALAAEDTRYRNEPIGQRSDLESFTPEDIRAHLAGPLSPANATVVVTGSFDRDAMVRLLRRYRGGRALDTRRARLVIPFAARRPGERELHVLAHPIEISTSREAAAAKIAQQLLDDALWRRFRNRGLGYSHSVEAIHTSWIDVLMLAMPARDSSGLDLGPYLKEAVAHLREGRFSDEDLERARDAASGALRELDADPSALAQALAEGGAGWHGQEVSASLKALDRAAFSAAVRPWLDPAASVYLYVGPNP